MKHSSVTCLLLMLLFFVPAAYAQDFPAWSAPVNLGPPVNSVQADWQPAISADGLSLYISRFCGPPDPGCNPSNAVLWVFHRANKSDQWGSPEQLPSTVNVAGKTKAMPYISADGHWLYFTRGGDIYRSYRNSTAKDSGPDGWQTAVVLGPNVNSPSADQMGCIFTDEAAGVGTMYFSSVRAQRPDLNQGGAGAGGYAYDIYASTLGADGTFGPAVLVPELNDPVGSQTNPTCSRDGLEMFFTSDRSGSIPYPVTPDDLYGPSGKPSPDIWVSTRAKTTDPWGPPQPLDQFNLGLGGPQISSEFHDGRPYLSQDGTELYFFSAFRNVGQPGGNVSFYFDIWLVTRPDPTPPNAPSVNVNPAPNAAGWNNSDVIVSFTSNGDPGHISTGVADCTADVSLSSDTSGFQVDGTCADHAGNVSDPASVIVKLDKTAPIVQFTGVSDGGSYLLGGAPSPACSSADALSGLASSASLSIAGGNAYGVGMFTATCSGASDVAGNFTPPLTATYMVTYGFTGFLPPLGSSHEFKLGSTIPLKWQLHDANGNYVSRMSTVQSLQLFYRGSCSAAGGDAVDLDSSGDTGLRVAGDQFHFNWQTKGLSVGCYDIVLTLDDATVHSARVSLK